MKQLKVCNTCLVLVVVPTLLSSIQMEVCGGEDLWGVDFVFLEFVHVLLGALMLFLVGEHLFIHWENQNWIAKAKDLKSETSRWLCAVFALMVMSCIAAFGDSIPWGKHSFLGALHGKIGLMFLFLCFVHLVKRWKWMKTQVFGKGKKQ